MHEKVGNANHKAMIRTISHPSDWLLSKRQERSIGQDVEKREPWGIWWNEIGAVTMEPPVLKVPRKTKITTGQQSHF